MSYDCPNCGTSGLDVFYEAGEIPVHSCMMLNRKEDALAFPRRALTLGACRQCAFISNVLFDSSVQAYTAGYEEQQSFSPRFRTFQTEMIGDLIRTYDLHHKDVVEIGCGKGDFLVELCETGKNRGIGIDPTSDPERLEGPGGERVRFLNELYGPQHADLPADFLCCRHTLEHIPATDEFVGVIRDVIGDRRDVVVFFEVPAVERVLEEEAFWDVYYEHCSYFSLGSLAHVFRRNRFDIVELRKDFDEQYLLIVVRPVSSVGKTERVEEDDTSKIAHGVATFREGVRRTIDGWRDRLTALKRQNRCVAVWGSGSKCVSFLSAMGSELQIDAIVDINSFRHGKWLAGIGRQVEAPESLVGYAPDLVVVMNPIYLDEIQRHLDTMGISAEVTAI